MESAIEISQTGGNAKPKPALGSKPRLAPKPFSLQKNNSIRSFYAPKTVAATPKPAFNHSAKAEATGVPKDTLTSPAQKPPQQPTTPASSKPSSVSVHIKDEPKTTKGSKEGPLGEDTLNSSAGPRKKDPAPEITQRKETPKSEPVQKEDVIQTSHKAPADTVTNSEQEDLKKEDKTSVIQKSEVSGSESSPTANPTYQWGSTRKPLSVELTSKFESGGQSQPPQPTVTVNTNNSKDNANKSVSSTPEQSQTTPEPSNKETDDRGLVDCRGGGSIKRRISLLFDSSPKTEVVTKKEEPEIITSAGGVKDRIKNWVMETSSESSKPQVPFRARSTSFESLTSPTAEKTLKLTPTELPTTGTSSTQAVAPSSKVPQAKQSTEALKESSEEPMRSSTETPGQHEQSKSTNVEVRLHNNSSSTAQTATEEGDSTPSESAQRPLKRDKAKHRSVHFGIVETDDGGPPLILGSLPDSSSEEEEAPEDKDEEKSPVSLPVYRSVGILQKKDDEGREQHLESEKRLTAEENEQARLKLEEDHKKQEKEEREKENAIRIMKEEKLREEERLRKLREEEIEKQKQEEQERERLKEKERKRLEELERERQMELVRQRQREEERERAKQKEERLKKDQEEKEKERLREEERKEERLREERERQRMKEAEERSNYENEGHRLEGKLTEGDINVRVREKQLELMWQRQKEEDRERARQTEERLRQVEKEKKRLLKEAEDRERARQIEEREKERLWKEAEDRERARQIEEREKERLWKEAEDRERARQIEEREKERLWKEAEDRERARQIEERLRQEEKEKERLWKEAEDRERARQIEERHRQEEREKERLWKEAEEREMQRRLEEEERMRAKLRQEQEEERKRQELERKMHQEEADKMERLRQIEQQREEERRQEERRRQMEQQRTELERNMQKEVERMQAKVLEENKLKMEEERARQLQLFNLQERVMVESNLTSLESKDVPQRSEMLHSPLKNTYEPPDSQIEVVYDDFSVRKPQIDVEFDDFSVKPKRWGSQAKVESHPVQSWRAEPNEKKEVEERVYVDVRPQENKAPELEAKPDSPEPTPAMESPDEEQQEEEENEEEEEEMEEEEEEEDRPKEGQLISLDLEEEKEENEMESKDEVDTSEDEAEDEDKQQTQVNSYCINEDRDTDALIDAKPDQQNGVCEHMSGTVSPKPIPEQLPEASSQGNDTTDFHTEPEFPPFPESSMPLLDTSAQRSKAVLGRRRSRTRPSRSLRFAPTKSQNWMIHDSTDEKEIFSKHGDSDSEEEQPKSKLVCSPPPTSQRVPTIPGLSPAALIAQLKRRTGGGGAGGGDAPEEGKQREKKENQFEEVAQSPSQLSRSPRSPAHLAGAALVLPPLGSPGGGAIASPAWLKELKSKKRLSQYDSEA